MKPIVMKAAIGSTALALCLTLLRCGAGGSGLGLDPNFGTVGVATIDFGTGAEGANAVALDASKNILLAGYSVGTTSDFAIARLTPAGVLDTTFSSDGKTTVDFSGAEDVAYAITVQADGKIVVVGRSGTGASAKLAVARLTTSGELDTGFGTGGTFTAVISSGFADFRTLALDSSARILTAGSAMVTGRTRFVLARLTTAGALDSGFGTSGLAVDTPGTFADTARALSVSTARIVVAGTQQVSASTGTGNFAAMGFTHAGAVDTSYGTSGTTTFDFMSISPTMTASDDSVTAASSSGGALVLTGTVSDGTTVKAGLVRLSESGALDTTFAASGGLLIPIQTSAATGALTDLTGNATTVATTGTSSYLLGATAVGLTSSSMTIVRISNAGTINTSYGTNGAEALSLGVDSADLNASALQNDGGWVLAGASTTAGETDFTAVRLTP